MYFIEALPLSDGHDMILVVVCHLTKMALFIPAVLQVSALHYLARSWVLEGFQTVASACALCQPTIAVRVFLSQHPQVQNLIRTERSLNSSEHRVKNKAS